MSDLVSFTGAELFQTCWFNNSDCAVPRRRLVGSVLVGFQRDAPTSFRSRLTTRLACQAPPPKPPPDLPGSVGRRARSPARSMGPERAMSEKMDLFQLHLELRKFFHQFLKLIRLIGLWKRGEQVLRSKWSSNEEGAFRQLHSIFK